MLSGYPAIPLRQWRETQPAMIDLPTALSSQFVKFGMPHDYRRFAPPQLESE
jgi:hypothetical protein